MSKCIRPKYEQVVSQQPTCQYNPSIHFTDEATKFHIRKCASKKFQEMSDVKKCTKYMSNLLQTSTTPLSTKCNLEQIKNICNDITSKFTLDDAVKICEVENKINSEYWRYKLKHNE